MNKAAPARWIPLLTCLILLGLVTLVWRLNPPNDDLPAATAPRAVMRANDQLTPVVLPQIKPAAAGPLADLDTRVAADSNLPEMRAGALAALRRDIPGVSVDFDPVSKSPKWIASNARMLTGARTDRDGDATILEFIKAHQGVFGHGPEVLDGVRRVTDYSTPRGPSRKVVWHQQHEGIEIFEAVLQANLTTGGELINIGSQFIPDPAGAANGTVPRLAVEEAVAAAGRNVGELMTAESVRSMSPAAQQPDRRQQFRAALLTDADARLTWVPMDERTMRLAWDVTLTSRSRAEMYRVLVDAETSDVLVRQALTSYISDATYRVFTTESPTPMSPGHEMPSSLQPPAVSRVLVTTPALNTTASPNGWINDGGNITSGNNTDAYTDTNADDAADLPRTTGTGRVFDFPHDLAQEPTNFKDASVTQLFYWTNFMHDRMYELGFTEAAGNFQTDNFGRGGIGNDPVNSEAQDGSGTNNANFSTPVDGGRGRMQMYNWTSPSPDRDGSFEAEVVLHEYGHGVSNRLVGGPSVSISALSTRGMGEGWSDFYGLALTAEASDNPHGNWSRGAWSRYLSSNWLSENYYYGARRYSYSTDMMKNPHTLRDIDPNQVDWHTSVPRNPTYAATQDATQVHYQGTVWCAMLWDLRANLIVKHGFNIGAERALFLVTEGMKYGPANPNFIQSRDGILQATLVNHPGDLGEVWTAFAKRGAGDGATAPVSSTTTGIVEQYDVPDSLEINDRSGWNIKGTKGGPFSPATKTLTLSNDGASSINWSSNAVPWLNVSPASGTLAVGANVTVTVTAQANAVEPGFHSANLVFTNTGTSFNQPIGIRLYVTPPVAQSFALSTNPGWTTSGEWAFGTPTGGGGSTAGGAGNADPTGGATGSNVFGVNLAGNAATAVGGPFYLTTTPVDLSARKTTRLRFKRWLNANALSSTRVTVEVSTNGTTWREIFVNPGTVMTDNTWQTLEYDISSLADRQPEVQVRWGYQNVVTGPAYSGWNIDDVEFLGEPTAQFSITAAANAPESAGTLTGTLTLNLPQDGPVTVTLASSDALAATVPATLSLAPGEVTKNFTITLVDDALLDGTQPAVITASASGIGSATHSLAVTDDETATLTLTAPVSVLEGASGVSGNLSVSAAPTKDISVSLTANLPALTVPASVTIPSGSTGPVAFTFSAPDNAFAEGVKNVTLTAAVTGWTSGVATVAVNDDESPTIVLTGPDAVRESDGPQTYTATVNTIQAADLTLNLVSDDTSELTVPASVVIPAGQFSATFDATILDDAAADGAQNVVITASGATYANATKSVSIADNEVDHYTWSAIASPQKRNTPFAVAVTARDINGVVITNHSGSVTLTSGSPGGAVPFMPAVMASFVNGVAAVDVAVTALATGMTLIATDGGGKTGASNAFDVQPVTHDTFVFSGIPASANADTLFNATATAVDDQGTTVTSYTDPTMVDILGSYFDRTVGSTSVTTGTDKIHNTAAHDSRCQIIYTAAELGGAAKLISGFFVSRLTTGGQAMSNYKVRMKHTSLDRFDGRSWEEDGWTTVYTSASYTASSTGHTFNLKPFAYDGVRNLMVDISFDNTSASTAGTLRQTPAATNRMLSGTSNSTHGDPTAWTAASGPAPVISNELPTMQFNEARPLGAIPASPVAFTAGVWSGQAVAPIGGSMWLRATAPSGVTGLSNIISILNPSSTVGTDTVFSDGFETGVLGALWSTAGNSGATARTQVTTANTPKTGTYHLTMDTTSTATGTFAANRPTLTLNLAGRKNVSLEWFAKSFADDSNTPTLTGPLGTFGSTMNYDGVAISQDGITWVEVSALRFLSSSYGTTATRVFLDPVIQRLGWSYNSTFQLRFSQYDDQAIANDGIGIDDVAVKANPATSIAVNLPTTITEGTLNQSVTVTLPAAAVSNTTVTLTSNAPARLSITSPIIILAGQTSASTTISAPQNAFADVGKGVIVTASASGQTTSYTHTRVVDDEQPVLTLALPASVTEGGTGTGTFFIEPVQPVATTVFLISGNTAEATVSASASITAGARSATFTITPVNDVWLDGTQTVSITASGQGLVSASGSVDVLDNEAMTLTITPPATLSEGGSPGVGTVALSGPRTVDTSVTLVSSDATEATVAGSVLIPAGQASMNFQVFPVEDSVQDGAQSVTLTASAAGLSDGSASFQVLDNDPASFEWAIVPSPQTRNAPFAVTLTARDATDNTLTGFKGTVALSAHSGATLLPLSATSSGAFVNGVWSGNLAVGAASTGVTLLATGGDGATGASDAFDVVTGGAAVTLAFAPLTSPHPAGVGIPVQVSAVDAAGLLVNETTGPVTVELVTSPGGVVVASASLTLANGAASTTFQVPVGISAVRLQATAGALNGQSGVFAIASPALISYPPPQVVFSDDFEAPAFQPEWSITGTGTHRTIVTTANGPRAGTRHMTMDSTMSFSNARNEATLTLNLAGKSDVELGFWMKESGDEDNGPPSLPFTGGADFDGVAISADGNTWYEVKGLRTADGISGNYTQFKVNLSAAAATHGLTLGSAFKIRFNHFDDYPFTTDGFAFDDITVTANAYTPPEPVAALFEDDFESGVFRPQWAITGTGNHRTQITSQQTPRGGYHMLMDAHVSGLFSRNEATLSLDLSGQQDVTLAFWMKEIGDEDHGPPSIPFMGGADFDGIAISQDGVSWYLVKGLRGSDGIGANHTEFTVDLSAAAAMHGLNLGADFKIRFNHYDDFPVTSDGFAFDDIRVTGRPVQQLVLSAPATLAEGGSAMAHITLPAVRAVDTVITLATNRPDGVTVPASITIPSGNTVSADFAITASQDAFLTGNLPVQVVATSEGFRRSVVEMTILDDETPAGFDLTLPATLAEGGTISGSVSMTSANLFDLSVVLSTSPAIGLTLPSSVALPAGATSASFDLTKAENNTIIEPASTTITASLGAGSDSSTVTLTDNDSSVPLVITLPATVSESAAPLTGSISFAPPVITGTDLTVTLTSSDTSELTVPATVVIPAGAGSVSFDITPVDDALSDGAIVVTLTASASGLTGDTHDISVRDDEVHHLAFDTISSPQTALGAFSISVRAESIDNQTVTNFTGTATLSAANAGGAVSMTPAGTTAFVNGIWTGPVTILTPASAVTLTASAVGGLTGGSNSFDVIAGPTLMITPGALNVTTLQGEGPMSQPLALSNPGTGSLSWSASIIGTAPWLSLSSSSGTIPQGENVNVTATLTPGALVAGVYNATLRFTSNDPAAPQQDVPVNFTLTAPVHHFDWSTIPSPQVANVPFAATLTAKDSAGNTLTSFSGSAALSLLGPASEVSSGAGTNNTLYPFWAASQNKHRTQSIYLPNEVGVAGRISGMSFNFYSAVTHSNVTIRLKHTFKSSYTGAATWESNSWTTVYSGPLSVSTSGWRTLNFSQPFDYDGSSNLMVDISFNNTGFSSGGNSASTTISTSRVLTYGDTGAAGSPVDWSGGAPVGTVYSSLTTIRFNRQPLVFSSPSAVAFANGTWSGNLAAQSSGTSLSAVATHAINTLVTGSSNTFDVTSTGSLSLSIPASGTEGGTLNGTVTASVAPASNLTVTFASSDASEAVPSASATILAGQTSAAFVINLPEDALLDGSQSVIISATAPAYNRAQATAVVNDNETTAVTLTLPATLAEGTSSTTEQASVQIATPAAADLTISLSSSLTSRLTVPASVVIPADQSSATFTLTAPNNSVIDGNQDTIITATLAGSSPATGTVQVTDNESRVLSVILFTTSTSEGSSPSTTAGYVSLAATTASPLTINLTSSDISELTVSSTVTIAAGSSTSSFFILTPVNDALIDGTQAVTLTATAATFTSATSSAISVLDDDVHHFTLSAVASPQVRNAPFNVTFTAKDINDTTITTYAGSPLLTAADGAASISVTPGTLTGFSSGVKTQTVSVGNDATNAVLTITDPGTGGNGSSNAFVVGLGALHHFGVSTIPASITQGQPQPVTVTAQDQGNNTIPSFTQTADLAISRDLQSTDTGASTGTWSLPLGSLGRSQRTQVIYLPAEVGAARPLHRLSLNVSTLPGSSLSNFTIRLKHTNKSNYSGAGTVQWESTGWTTVHQSTATISTTGWKQFVFTAPFMYDGSSPLMIDFSYYNAGSGSVEGNTYYTNSGAVRTVLAESYSDYGSPLAWSGSTNPVPITNNAVPTVRFGTDAASVPVSPVVTGAFENGQWSGVFTPGGTGVSVSLRATNGTTTGASPPFTVIAQPNLAVSLPTTAVESAGLVAGTVSLNAAVGTDTTVTLASSAPAQVAPAASSVTIPAGSTSASFNLSIVDDTLPEGDQVVTITASSPGVMAGVANVTVLDNDPHHFAFIAVGTQVRGVPFNITVTAQSSTNAALSGFTGTVNFSAAAGVSPVTITPTASGAFASGVWTGTMTVSQAANNVALTASDAAGHTGTSSLFNVSSGPASRFQWTAQPSHVVPGTAFPVTITAVDAYGDTATSFASTANLGVINPETSTTTVGAGLFASTVPLYTFQADCRGQVIYKRSEVGPARRITGLALNISTTSSFVYNNFTLRLRHTKLGNFNSSPAWESTGWTVAWQGNHTFSTSGWTTFTFTTPFDYNGTDNLMVDISTDNTTSGSGAWLRRDPTGYDVGMVYQYGASYGAPTSWSGATPPISSAIERPQIRFLGNPGITITPAVTGTFVNGSWSGNLTVNSTHPAIVLQAVGGEGISGASAPVHSGFVAPSFSAEPAFTGGIANTLSWSASPGSATYALERDTLNTFTSPFILSDLPSTSTAISGLQDGTQYHYRVRGISNASVPASLGEWQQTSFADFNTAAHSNTSAYLSLHDVTLAASGTSPTTWTENFETSGTSWASTIFSATGGAATMDRQIMSSGPNTSPALPVNQNGDMEGRIGNDSGTSTGYAFMPATAANTFQDGSIEGYLAPEGATSYLYGTLLLRASLSATNGIQGYAAFANFGPSNVTFSVQVMLNGILNTLATSGSISYTATDNFKMRLNAQGNSLTLQVWRVSVIGGVVTETPLAINGSNTSINVTDTTFNTGRAALYFTAASGRCYFDDITVTNNSPVFVPSGTATSPVIAPAYKQNWGTLSYQLDTSSPGASASVDVLDFNGNLLAANVASGTDLATFPAISASSSLKLRANMSSTNAASTPYLRSWTLGYVLSSAAPLTSPWSNTVSSTQDASPPALSIPDLTTANASATLTGTATDATSGVSGVTVGGNAATTANAFANWMRNVTGLADGSNSITVTASDNAVPPNTANVTAIVYRITTPTGDPNNNGINALVEHALGIPAGAPNAHSMLPAATVQTEPGTGAKYLSMQFRRRIQRSGLAYMVETSTNLTNWDDTGASVQEMSVTPTGDGVTEAVTVRVNPAMSASNTKGYVRLRITTN